jgi:hypothetical protein
LCFHISEFERRVAVAPAFCRFWSVLDRFNRAEMQAGAAHLAVVPPDRFFLNHIDIFHRADCCTGPAGSAIPISNKLLVGIMDLSDEPVIPKPFQKR